MQVCDDYPTNGIKGDQDKRSNFKEVQFKVSSAQKSYYYFLIVVYT